MRPTFAEIDLAALRYNFKQLSQLSGNARKVLAIVKADAYGHGALEISSELEKCGTDLLGVATCEEAVELRKAGIRKPIIIMGGIFDGQLEEIVQYDLIPVIFDVDTAEQLNTISAQNHLKVKIHVKIDTGMGRIGIMPWEVESFCQKLRTCKNLILDGLLTHLSVADKCSADADKFTAGQIRMFSELVTKVKAMGLTPSYLHLANSAAIIRNLGPAFNLLRPGLMLYGVTPSPQLPFDLKPVMSLKTRIIALKKLPKDFTVSYGNTFITERETLIATLPIGYADGYTRLLSNKAMVLVRGHRAPVVGLVCMDMIMLDVTDVPGVAIHDEAILLGTHGKESITVHELAGISQSIPYEFFCNLGKRIPRIYVHPSTS